MRFDGTLTALSRAGFELEKAVQSLEGEMLIFQGWDKTQCSIFLKEVKQLQARAKDLFATIREKSC